MRHDPHLDLAVVGGHQRLVARAHHERLADRAALLGADRDVLQVRVGARQAPGRGDELVERRVDAAVRHDRLEQALDGLPQPDTSRWRSSACRNGSLALLAEPLERVGVGGVAGLGALGLGQSQLVEEHLLELLGRAEVDLLADHRVGLVGGQLTSPAKRCSSPSSKSCRRRCRSAPSRRAPRPGAARPRPSRAVPPRSASSSSSAAARSSTARACSIAVSPAVGSPTVSKVSWPSSSAGRSLQLALEVAQGEVGQVVGALVGPGEVRRQRGVARRGRAAASLAPRERASGPWRRAAPCGGSPSASHSASACVVGGLEASRCRPRPLCRRRRPAPRRARRRCRRPSAPAPGARPAARQVRAPPARPRPRPPPAARPRARTRSRRSPPPTRACSKSRSRSTRNSRPSKTCAPPAGPRGAPRGRQEASASGRGRTPRR